jgi:asparagine synthase (glutamine-hydrolysing)
MCGVAAIYSYLEGAPPVDIRELDSIKQALARRGPDGNGLWTDRTKRVGLAHTRLAVIDLSERAAQPMSSADGNVTIAFNGEIYNYKRLRASLESEGCRFLSQSDTEVLLQLYQKLGAGMLGKLRGMYAFALWDGMRQRLFCARDPYGIKPLYYSRENGQLRVASQVKALRAGGAVSNDIDPAGAAGFALFGHVPEPHTMWRGIRSLPAGHYMLTGPGEAPQVTRYHSIAEVWKQAPAIGDDAEAGIRNALQESVRDHCVADVPLGLFLSAGVDSAAVAGLMRDAGAGDISAITLAFEEYRGSDDDEAPLAAATARRLGIRHHVAVIDSAWIEARLDGFLADMDQPSIDGLNTWLVSGQAREQGLKVALCGTGGDELFGGYPSFSDIPRWTGIAGMLPHALGKAARAAMTGLIGIGVPIPPKAAAMPELGRSLPTAYLLRRGLFLPWELEAILGRELAAEGLERLRPIDHIGEVLQPDPGDDFTRIATLESSLYLRNQLLRDADWAGMSNSVEIRTPLVDARLLKCVAWPLKTRADLRTKQVLAAAPAEPLPPSVVSRPKTGFTVPLQPWLENTPQLAAWRRVPLLRTRGCHWARRWAYTILDPVLNPA